MHEQEGVIKYQLKHTHAVLTNDLPLAEINAWRSILYKLHLIGQDPCRYGGLGYGNLSQRINPASQQFIISSTQTGHLEHLTRHDYCVITHASPENNTIDALGECQPSSEALTHASVYAQYASIQAVIHVHSPEIWRQTQALNLAHTAATIPYGTPEMAEAVARLLQDPLTKQSALFTMLGHEDGVISFGNSLAEAGRVLVNVLVRALMIANPLT